MNQVENCEDVLREKCAPTQEVGADKCNRCGQDIPASNRVDAKFCSRACQKHSARDMEAGIKRDLKIAIANIVYKYLHRDKYISFDGTYAGPLNKSLTFVIRIKKDKGFRPMPSDVHTPALEPKFTTITHDDLAWGRMQGSRSKGTMPRLLKSFCAQCVDVVIDGSQNKVRVTKGCYRPIDHDCGTQVYSLKGELIGVKTI